MLTLLSESVTVSPADLKVETSLFVLPIRQHCEAFAN